MSAPGRLLFPIREYSGDQEYITRTQLVNPEMAVKRAQRWDKKQSTNVKVFSLHPPLFVPSKATEF
jgi:hypothetical protein